MAILVSTLVIVCTGALLVFLIASAFGGSFARTARLGYFAVYLSAAAACLTAGFVLRGQSVHWHWLAPAIASIPVAIVVGRWNVTLSDSIALLFYPFAIVTVVKSTSRPRPAVTRRSLDRLLGVTAVATIGLYVAVKGIEVRSLYQFLAPGAAVLLAVPAVIQTIPWRERQGDVSIHLLFAGLLVAAFSDATPFGWSISSFAWACAVWLIAVGAAVACFVPTLPKPGWESRAALPSGWWSVSLVGAVCALIALQLHRVEPTDVRLLVTGGTLLTAFILVRQFVALRDNEDLIGAREIQEAQFRELVRRSSDAFVILDTNGRIIYDSPALKALSRRVDADHHRRKVKDVLAVADEAVLDAGLDYVALNPGRSHLMNLSVRTAAGVIRHVEVTATNRRDEPTIDGIVLNIRDITERVELERQLARHDKMEAVSRMAAGTAHEFNNLLTVIMGHVDLLSSDRNRPADVADGLDQIRHAAERAADVTRSLLGVARKRPTDTCVVNANGVIRRVEAMLRSGIGPEYEIVVLTTDALWAAGVDPDDLEHALLNLALNARDAMPDGGSITIATTNVTAEDLPTATPMPRQDFVRLTVQDTGAGIPADVVSHVFEPFFSTKPEGRGTGLGLAIVYSAVRRNGGFIDVMSSVGQGTTFTLWLPRA